MTATMRYVFAFLATVLPLAALAVQAHAEPPKTGTGFTWPSQYDFFLPYGTRDGGPIYAKPGFKGVNLTLTCKEATGLLERRGYDDIEAVACSGSTYHFRANGKDGQFVIEIDPRTGNILRRLKL